MAELQRLSDEQFSALLASVGTGGGADAPADADGARTRLRVEVALLSAFDAGSLPAGTDGERAALDAFLLEDCERVVTRSGARWGLRAEVRAAALRQLAAEGTLAPYPGRIDAGDAASRMAARYLAGDAPPLAEQSVDDLRGTAQAAAWLSGTPVAVPSIDAAVAQRAINEMLDPLRQLVADGFVGRTEELAALAQHTLGTSGERPAGSLAEPVPLVVHGVGGAGKSTLIARFVLDHVDGPPAGRFPFAYLSFDRSDLRVEQPLTLLAEAARQLAVLFPALAADALTLAESARATVASAVASADDQRVSKRSSSVAAAAAQADEQVLVKRYAALVASATGDATGSAGAAARPHVWVLDTFEVAQRQSPRSIEPLWAFLGALQRRCAALRVVVCGRVPVADLPATNLSLGPLDEPSALQLLHLQLDGLHLPEVFLRDVVAAVGMQPLSLRLAVLLIRAEAERTDLRSAAARRAVIFQLRGNDVRGVVYRRVLDHLEDPDVRRIAHPGFVVRRISADVLRQVVAGPCGLGELDAVQAAALLGRLDREVALVREVSPGVLEMRPDLRALMLPMAERDAPAVVAALRKAAVRHYSHQPGFDAKVEELYYRLVLGQASATLDKAFDPDAAAALGDGVLDELPPSSQVYLATRLGRTVPAAVLAQADDLAWGRQVELSARQLLDMRDANGALELVRSRRNDAVTPYTAALEVEVLATVGRHDEAIAAAETARAWATSRQRPDVFVAVTLLGARVCEDLGDFLRALGLLREAARVAGSRGDLVAECAAGAAILRVHRRAGTADSEEAVDCRARLIESARRLSSRDRARNPSLVRDLAGEVGDELPDITREALRLGATPSSPPPSGSGVAPELTEREAAWEVLGDLDKLPGKGADVRKAFRDQSDLPSF